MVEQTQEPSARDSRRAILDAARAEFDAAGFAGARVQRIADSAGVNKQLIFYYHGSKRGLYRDVVRASLEDVSAAAADDGGPKVTKRLRHQVTALCDALSTRPHLWRLLINSATAEAETDAHLVEATFTTLISRLVGIVTDGQRLGYFRENCDAIATARHAISLVLGHLMLRHIATTRDPTGSRGVDIPDSVCRVLLRSLEW